VQQLAISQHMAVTEAKSRQRRDGEQRSAALIVQAYDELLLPLKGLHGSTVKEVLCLTPTRLRTEALASV